MRIARTAAVGVAALALALAMVRTGRSQSPSGANSTAARQLLRMINAARANPRYREETHGQAQALRWNPALAAVATQHSRQMADNHRLSHLSNTGLRPSQRVSRAGIAWTVVGENVAYAPSAADVQKMMMSEPAHEQNHRGNILSAKFTEIGIGVVRAGDELYVTEDFIRPPAAQSANGAGVRH